MSERLGLAQPVSPPPRMARLACGPLHGFQQQAAEFVGVVAPRIGPQRPCAGDRLWFWLRYPARRRCVPEGFVGGIDHSKSMVQLATSKNRVAIGAGHVRLSQGSATDLPYESDSFDVVFATNVAQFWDQPVQVAREIRRVLKPGGRVALAVQPRNKGATDATAHEIGEKLLAALAETGFTLSRLERKPLGRVPVVCTLAVKS